MSANERPWFRDAVVVGLLVAVAGVMLVAFPTAAQALITVERDLTGITDLREELGSTKEKLREANDESDRLRSRIRDIEADNLKLERALKVADGMIDHLKLTFNQKEFEASELRTQVQDLQQRLAEATGDRIALTGQAPEVLVPVPDVATPREFESLITQLQERVRELERTNEALRVELQQKEEVLRRQERIIRDQRNEIELLLKNGNKVDDRLPDLWAGFVREAQIGECMDKVRNTKEQACFESVEATLAPHQDLFERCVTEAREIPTYMKGARGSLTPWMRQMDKGLLVFCNVSLKD